MVRFVRGLGFAVAFVLWLFTPSLAVAGTHTLKDGSTLRCPDGVELLTAKVKVPGAGSKKSWSYSVAACDLKDGRPHEFAYFLKHRASKHSYRTRVTATGSLLHAPWPADGPNPVDREKYFHNARNFGRDDFPHQAHIEKPEPMQRSGRTTPGVLQFDGPGKKARALIFDGAYQWVSTRTGGGDTRVYTVTGAYQAGEKVGEWEFGYKTNGKAVRTEEETFEVIDGVGLRTRHIAFCRSNPEQQEHRTEVDYSKSFPNGKYALETAKFDCATGQRILKVLGPGAPGFLSASPNSRPRLLSPNKKQVISREEWSESGQLRQQVVTDENGTQTRTEWWPNGQMRESGTRLDGRWNGPNKNWNQDGVLVEEGTKTRRRWDGPYRRWYDDGTLREDGFKEMGSWAGLYFEFDHNGALSTSTISRVDKMLDGHGNRYKAFRSGAFEEVSDVLASKAELFSPEQLFELSTLLVNAYVAVGHTSPTDKLVSCKGLGHSGLLADSGYCSALELIGSEQLPVTSEQRQALGFEFAKKMLADGELPAFLYKASGGRGREGTAREVLASIKDGSLPELGRFVQVHKLVEGWPHLSDEHRSELRALNRDQTAKYLEYTLGVAREESAKNAKMACFGDCRVYECRLYRYGARSEGDPWRRQNVCASSEADASWKTEEKLCDGMGNRVVAQDALGLTGTGGYDTKRHCEMSIACNQTGQRCTQR
jgi:hypothetical protein